MCTTTQYLYSCSHQATHRFRNRKCEFPNSRICRVRDDDAYLPYMCRHCIAKGRTRPLFNFFGPMPTNEKNLYHDTWHIPSRCFVDVGFRNLDPFKTGKLDELETPKSSPSPARSAARMTFETLTQRAAMDEIDCCGQLKAWPRKLKREPSPCCLNQRRNGAFETTRLEGCEYRIEGRIIDSGCQSRE